MPTNRPELINDVLLELLQDLDPLVQAASLYALHLSNPADSNQQARAMLEQNQQKDWLVQETAQRILGQTLQQNDLGAVPTFIAQVRTMGHAEKRVFQQPVIQVGRGRENDIVIVDNRVSRQHAIFYLDEKGVSVRDLGSSNGLRIGKEHIREQQKQLKSGDIVRFSNGDELIILVQWEMQHAQGETTTDSFGTLEKLLWLYGSSFFQGLKANALINLARDANVRVYRSQEEICRVGTPATELLILIDGEASVLASQTENTAILPGQTIGELEVLTHSNYMTTIVAASSRTRVLAINAKAFEVILSYDDSVLAKNLLARVSTRLQQSLGQVAAVTQI
ncbi:MAG: FHA domain-containing protein [Rhizonema sp. PD38]|nr:FHA domain-containing protein [Rhizonema sp. PD38]